jgi:hypothetical protein
MSKVSTALAVIENILSVAGPLIVALVGKDNGAAAAKVLKAVSAATAIASNSIENLEAYVTDLQDIQNDLNAMKAAGGVGEGDFDASADRIEAKTDRLSAVVAERAAAKAAS